MTVVVQCFHCNAILELDEGFRGGVCRCGSCGSLLQVPPGDPDPTKGAKRIRPAAPPSPSNPSSAPASGGAAAQAAAAKNESGLSSGRFDPRQMTDMGGSSSGLGRIHKTKPISHAPSASRSSSESHVPLSPAHGLPAMRAIKRNKSMFWFAILLTLAIALVVIGLVVAYTLRSDSGTPPVSPSSAPMREAPVSPA